jgi:hypothetical protein
LVFVATPLSTQHEGVRANTGLFGIRIIYQSGVTFLYRGMSIHRHLFQ